MRRSASGVLRLHEGERKCFKASSSQRAYNHSHRSSVGVPFMSVPRTLGDLRRSNFSEERLRTRRVKDELRDNLVTRLREKGDAAVFPGIVGI
jgi:hypothetical protein